jgi:hypothetical protein
VPHRARGPSRAVPSPGCCAAARRSGLRPNPAPGSGDTPALRLRDAAFSKLTRLPLTLEDFQVAGEWPGPSAPRAALARASKPPRGHRPTPDKHRGRHLEPSAEVTARFLTIVTRGLIRASAGWRPHDSSLPWTNLHRIYVCTKTCGSSRRNRSSGSPRDVVSWTLNLRSRDRFFVPSVAWCDARPCHLARGSRLVALARHFWLRRRSCLSVPRR